MNILAVDTATMSASVALVGNGSLIAESTFTEGRTHSKTLMVLIKNILSVSKVEPKLLDGFAVSIGPGTFTGLRIGVSTIKGMASALNKPVAAVCSLEALAHRFVFSPFRVVPLIDARRGEVYVAEYEFHNGKSVNSVEARVSAPEKAIAHIKTPSLMVGSGAVMYKDRIKNQLGDKALFVPDHQNYISAADIAVIGHKKIVNQEASVPELLVPLYIRKSDAQIHMEHKENDYRSKTNS